MLYLDPPIEKLSFSQKLEQRISHFASNHPRLALITAVACGALAVAAMIFAPPTTLGWIAFAIGGALIGEMGSRILSGYAKEWNHTLFDKKILPFFFTRKNKPPPQHTLPPIYKEKEIRNENKELIAKLHYQKEQPVLEIHTTDPDTMGYVQGILVAPQINELFRRTVKPTLEAEGIPSLAGRVKNLVLPSEYDEELEGMARGLKDYAALTNSPIKPLGYRELLLTQLFHECQAVRAEADLIVGNKEAAVAVSLPSQGILGKYTLIRRHKTAEGTTVTSLTHPGFLGGMVAHSDKGVIAVATKQAPKDSLPATLRTRRIAENKAEASAEVVKCALEECASEADLKAELIARDTLSTTAGLRYKSGEEPIYGWDNYYALRRFTETAPTADSAA